MILPTEEELKGQIIWFRELKEAHLRGDRELVGKQIEAALKLLERELAEQGTGSLS